MRRGFGWEGFGFGLGSRAWSRGPRGRRPWFASGDMKYVILKLLQEKPKHGYEVMKDLEDRMRGCYSPSPGTVYPTLQWLDDEGLVSARDVEGKKVYEITDSGRRFLEEHRDLVDEIFDRVAEAVERVAGGAMVEVNRAVGRVLKAAYRAGWRAHDEDRRKRVADILSHAAEEIEALTGSA